MPPRYLLLEAVCAVLFITPIVHAAFIVTTADDATFFEVVTTVSTCAVVNLPNHVIFVIHTLVEYLCNGLLMPHWVLWLIIAAYSLPSRVTEALGVVVAAPFQVIARIYQTYLDYQSASDERITALQRRLAEIEASDEPPEKFSTTHMRVDVHKSLIEKVAKEGKRWENEAKDLQIKTNALDMEAKNAKADFEVLQKRSSPSKLRKMEQSQKYVVHRLRETIAEKSLEIKELESKLDLWKTQNLQHDCTLSSKGGQKLQVVIDTLNDDIQRLITEKGVSAKEMGDLKTKVHHLEPQVAKFNNTKEVIHRMSESNDPQIRFAAVVFVESLLSHGANLAEFGIDPSRYEAYVDWAKILIDGGNPPVVPTIGFRLSGTFFPLSSSFVSGDKIFGASTNPLEQTFAAAQAPLMLTPPTTPPHTPPQHGPSTAVVTYNAGANPPAEVPISDQSHDSWNAFIRASNASIPPPASSSPKQGPFKGFSPPKLILPAGRLTPPTEEEEVQPAKRLDKGKSKDLTLYGPSHANNHVAVNNNSSAFDASAGAGSEEEQRIDPDAEFALSGENPRSSQPTRFSTISFASLSNSKSLMSGPGRFSSPPNAPSAGYPAFNNAVALSRATAGAGVHQDLNSFPASAGTGAPFSVSSSTDASASRNFSSSQNNAAQPFASPQTNASSFGSSRLNNASQFSSFPGTGQHDDEALRAALARSAPPNAFLSSNHSASTGNSSGFGGQSARMNSVVPFSMVPGAGQQEHLSPFANTTNMANNPSSFVNSSSNSNTAFGRSDGFSNQTPASSFGQPVNNVIPFSMVPSAGQQEALSPFTNTTHDPTPISTSSPNSNTVFRRSNEFTDQNPTPPLEPPANHVISYTLADDGETMLISYVPNNDPGSAPQDRSHNDTAAPFTPSHIDSPGDSGFGGSDSGGGFGGFGQREGSAASGGRNAHRLSSAFTCFREPVDPTGVDGRDEEHGTNSEDFFAVGRERGQGRRPWR